MKLFDYYLKDTESSVTADECGNLYIEGDNLQELWEIFKSQGMMALDTDYFFISKEDYDRINQFQILENEKIDKKKIEWHFARNPLYRLRGKPVTEEQAFDIIRRTDGFFWYIPEIAEHEEYMNSYNFSNSWISSWEGFWGYGWAHRDGMIGLSAVTGKNPSVDGMVREWVDYLLAFPYLDLVIAVTEGEWERRLDKALKELHGRNLVKGRSESEVAESRDCDREFYASVCLGIWVHDKTIEILDREDGLTVYKEYASLYGKYMVRQTKEDEDLQLDLPYLKKCVRAYGLDPDAALGQLRWGKDFLRIIGE